MQEPTEFQPQGLSEHQKALNQLATVKQSALDTLENRRQADLDELLHADPTFALENPILAARLKDKFLKDKKDRIRQIRESGREPNIGDMFNLAVEYFGLIGVVKLAETNHDVPNESFRLKQEFEELMQWLSEKGVETPKLSRAESNRWFAVDIVGNQEDGPDGYRAVIHRVRPLILTEISVLGESALSEPAQLMIIKETVVSIPAGLYFEIMSTPSLGTVVAREMKAPGAGSEGAMVSTGYDWTERKKEMIEEYIYGKLGGEDVQRINTAYLSALVPMSTHDALLGDSEDMQ